MLLTAATSSVLAEETAPCAPTLQPYKAEYTTTARGMTVTLERELKTDGEGGYTLTNGGTLLVVGFHEVAVFAVEDAQVQPRSYIYQGTGLINRRREVHFTPGADTVRSLYKEEWYELPYTEGTLDRMSQQEQLRLHLMSRDDPRQNISVRIADGKRVKNYELVYVSDEILETPLGPVNALHFERLHDDPDRESDIWFAPEWDYLMVKTVHIEDDKPVEVLLSDARIGGTQVVASSARH
ncbi:DUF3108 domain-containing protein [Haliea sp. E1-2-M8]|uniref:DUF3108 domain-containing protein n=1 Tax=Haliea sp. E1-2-M8 TaxID=3064706 RepID=UPI002717260E|nr:DUF3108 domain-containing protein [Haliea sp. E1-2-M8]MDO8862181.1 DUF3108 domain-containing protein [Haliea sp. E1-2-M8]